ncbi:hypothetical protein [Polyangium spumosum]|uniref:Uncharacterized protein n=1 Tax=Polyangium spumosum TaxID=889282 RepID=A0A6N7PIL2_9BACT|nr:hypothetical protein [Polyangium spumosum]MRG91657.1 hypothetical protein [Polyangium spumosum]
MLIVTCTPVPGFKVYRCGFREEIRDGRTVRVGLSWPAGETRLPDDALTPEQIDALKRDPGKRISLTHVPDALPVDRPPVRTVEPTPLDASSSPPSAALAPPRPTVEPTPPDDASSALPSATPAPPRPAVEATPLDASSRPPSAAPAPPRPAVEATQLDASSPPPSAAPGHSRPTVEPTPLDASSPPPSATPGHSRPTVAPTARRDRRPTAPRATARGPPAS